MRFMIIVKATKESEAGVMPDDALLTSLATYHEQLAKAGVLLDGSGLQASSKGWRIQYDGDKHSTETRTVIDGPFAETKELVAGYWLWQVKSMEEAIAWVKRCPNPMSGDSEIEIRRVFEADDFGEAFTPELREQEDRIRAATEKIKK